MSRVNLVAPHSVIVIGGKNYRARKAEVRGSRFARIAPTFLTETLRNHGL
jgi:hypothetical protein